MVKKLLIVTQKVDKNDPVLGFFHTWLLEFAKQVEQVIVIGLSVGEHNLPKNVRVISLEKEKGKGRIARTITFLQTIIALKREYDSVFVHMNPEYVALAGLIWQGMRKKVSLWYTHRNVDLKLKLAVTFSDVVFTASPESCRIKSKKIKIIGHGVDVDLFNAVVHDKSVDVNRTIRIAHIGRITPIKNCETLIEAISLINRERPVSLTFVGGGVMAGDTSYEANLSRLIKERGLEDQVIFKGSIVHAALPAFLSSVDVTINGTPTGGLDKVVLESMAAGVPVLTSNTSFSPFFGDNASRLIFKERDAKDLAFKIVALCSSQDFLSLGEFLKKSASRFGIPRLIGQIITELKTE